MIKKIKEQKGYLLAELLIAIAIMAVMLTYAWRLMNYASKVSTIIRDETQANFLAQEYLELAKSRRNESWDAMFKTDDPNVPFGTNCSPTPGYTPVEPAVIYGNSYHFEWASNGCRLLLRPGGVKTDEAGTISTTGRFTNQIIIERVYRNSSTNLISSNTSHTLDDKTLLITSRTTWAVNGETHTIEKKAYLTDWYGF